MAKLAECTKTNRAKQEVKVLIKNLTETSSGLQDKKKITHIDPDAGIKETTSMLNIGN